MISYNFKCNSTGFDVNQQQMMIKYESDLSRLTNTWFFFETLTVNPDSAFAELEKANDRRRMTSSSACGIYAIPSSVAAPSAET
jgi:hypothetical protein